MQDNKKLQDNKAIPKNKKKQEEKKGYQFITEFDNYLFGQGTHYDLYNKMGAHPMTLDGKKGVFFCGVGAERAEGFRCGRF